MTSSISEFIDSYSDDIIYLQEARNCLLIHPLKNEVDFLCNASFCRMFSIIMIGSIEHALEHWKNEDTNGILQAYFATHDQSGKKIENGDKVRNLRQAFVNAGVKVDEEVFEDYLAIKYLRNTIIHSEWKKPENDQVVHIVNRGFPTDTRKLTEEHWKKMQSVNDNMLFYISLAYLGIPLNKFSNKTLKIERNNNGKSDLGLISKEDISIMLWRNLEKISKVLTQDMREPQLLEKYNWAENYSENEVKEMEDDKRKKLYYLALRRAGRDKFSALTKNQNLIETALDSWTEYWKMTFEQSNMSREKVIKAKDILCNFSGENLTEEQKLSALSFGEQVYNFLPNITPVYLFLVQAPIVDPNNSSKYFELGKVALECMELKVRWRNLLENTNDDVSFYRDLLEMKEYTN